MSRVADRTDKAGRMAVKGARAEEEYLLIDILSGCIVNSYMSVTGRGWPTQECMLCWNQVECYGNEEDL